MVLPTLVLRNATNKRPSFQSYRLMAIYIHAIIILVYPILLLVWVSELWMGNPKMADNCLESEIRSTNGLQVWETFFIAGNLVPLLVILKYTIS